MVELPGSCYARPSIQHFLPKCAVASIHGVPWSRKGHPQAQNWRGFKGGKKKKKKKKSTPGIDTTTPRTGFISCPSARLTENGHGVHGIARPEGQWRGERPFVSISPVPLVVLTAPVRYQRLITCSPSCLLCPEAELPASRRLRLLSIIH